MPKDDFRFLLNTESQAFLYCYYFELMSYFGDDMWEKVAISYQSENSRNIKTADVEYHVVEDEYINSIVSSSQSLMAVKNALIKLGMQEVYEWLYHLTILEGSWVFAAIFSACFNLMCHGAENGWRDRAYHAYLVLCEKATVNDPIIARIDKEGEKDMDEEEKADVEKYKEALEAFKVDYKKLQNDIIKWTNTIGDRYVEEKGLG